MSFTTAGPQRARRYQPSKYRLCLVPEENVFSCWWSATPSAFPEHLLMVNSELAVEVTPSAIDRHPDGSFRKITISKEAFDAMFEVVE
jgi:hypothetical protein